MGMITSISILDGMFGLQNFCRILLPILRIHTWAAHRLWSILSNLEPFLMKFYKNLPFAIALLKSSWVSSSYYFQLLQCYERFGPNRLEHFGLFLLLLPKLICHYDAVLQAKFRRKLFWKVDEIRRFAIFLFTTTTRHYYSAGLFVEPLCNDLNVPTKYAGLSSFDGNISLFLPWNSQKLCTVSNHRMS